MKDFAVVTLPSSGKSDQKKFKISLKRFFKTPLNEILGVHY